MAKLVTDSAEHGEALNEVHRRRRWTFVEKLCAAQESSVPGTSVSSVARKYGMAPSQLFRWRKVILDHVVDQIPAVDHVELMTEMQELKRQIRELERLLGKKTLENEMLREAIAVEKPRNDLVPRTIDKRLRSDM